MKVNRTDSNPSWMEVIRHGPLRLLRRGQVRPLQLEEGGAAGDDQGEEGRVGGREARGGPR